MKRIVFAPMCNSFAHISDCMAIAAKLDQQKFEISFLAAEDKKNFILSCGYPLRVTKEIWETGNSLDILRWFDDRNFFLAAVELECEALRSLAPDLVVGSYRYTTAIACRRLSIRHFSVIPACMSPSFIGFPGIPQNCQTDSTNNAIQTRYTQILKRLIGESVDESLTGLTELRHLLMGDKTFLNVLQQFEPVEIKDDSVNYIGPIVWKGWAQDSNVPPFQSSATKKILVFLGSALPSELALHKVLSALAMPEIEVVVVARKNTKNCGRHLYFVDTLDLQSALPQFDLAIVHGGLNVIHQCLRWGVPTLILPLHAEQAQNALRAEQIGFGQNLYRQTLEKVERETKDANHTTRLRSFSRYYHSLRRVDLDVIYLQSQITKTLENSTWRKTCAALSTEWQPLFGDHSAEQGVVDCINQYFA